MLERYFETPRRKFNVIASLVLPPVTTTLFSYFYLLNGKPSEDPWYITAAKATTALASNIPVVFYELGVGAALATISCIQLDSQRTLESKIPK